MWSEKGQGEPLRSLLRTLSHISLDKKKELRVSPLIAQHEIKHFFILGTIKSQPRKELGSVDLFFYDQKDSKQSSALGHTCD